MSHVSERDRYCKLRSLAFNTADIYSAVMLQNDAFCNGKTKAGAPDLPRPGFVDAVESFVDLIKGVLRNSDTRILDTDIEIIGISVDRNADFPVIPVILDRVLHEIGDHHDHLDLVDLRVYLSHADHRQLDIPLLRNRTESSEYQFDHLIDVAFFNIQSGILPVHSDKGEKLCYDLIFSIHLILDVDHELPVHLNRHIVLLHQRIRQDFHGCHGRLKFMGHI